MTKDTQSAPIGIPGVASRLRLSPPTILLLLCLIGVCLAVTAMIDDSVTYDEMYHLTAGASYLHTGDFRLAPDAPPLAKQWMAVPVVLRHPHWPCEQWPAWQYGDLWDIQRPWFYEVIHGPADLLLARTMIILLLPVLCVTVYLAATRLWARGSGLMAAALTVLSPTILAHAGLATTDIAATVTVWLTILTFAGFLCSLTWHRLLLTAVFLAAAAMVKYSWLLLLPTMASMTLVWLWRRWGQPGNPRQPSAVAGDSPPQLAESPPPPSRIRDALLILGAWLLIAVVVWAAIWAAYGFRYSPFHPSAEQPATMTRVTMPKGQWPQTMPQAWQAVLLDKDGHPLRGPVVTMIRWARSHQLLPQAYLYGMAFTLHHFVSRTAYLCGDISQTGWPSYFPIAFAIKTPIPILFLVLTGLLTLIARNRPTAYHSADPATAILLTGILTYLAIYALTSVTGSLNIGHRHILPMYPGLFIIASATATWWRHRFARFTILAAMGWLILANALIFPHYLCYFNELIGGPKNGHRYLADSNIDWGQDLKRLARYHRDHPGEPLKLAYFGTALPAEYGIDCQMLPSTIPFTDTPAELTPGTYVVSVTQMVGVNAVFARSAVWAKRPVRRQYRQLYDRFADSPGQVALRPGEAPAQLQNAYALYQRMRRGLLLYRLCHRSPEQRIGYSLFVHRLDQQQLTQLLRPPDP